MLTWGALVVATVVGLLLLGVSSGGSDPSGQTASAAVLSFVSPESGPASVLARVVLFVATAVLAGLGLARALVGVRPVGAASQQVARVAGATAGLAAVGGGLLGDASWPWALAHLVLVVAVVALLPRGGNAGPVAVVLAAVLAAETAAGRQGLALPLELIASIGTTVAVGVAIAVVTESTSLLGGQEGEGRLDRVARRRVAVTGVLAGAAAGLAGLAAIGVEGPWTTYDLLTGPGGLAVLARTVLPLLAVLALAPDLRAPGSVPAGVAAHRRRERARWASIGLVGAVAAAAVIGALPAAPDAPVAGKALLRPVQLGLERMALLVAPSPGGPTLMRISPSRDGGEGGAAAHADHTKPAPAPAGYSVRVGGRSVSFTPRAGAPGAWALVDLPAGTTSVTVTGPGGDASVPVETGAATPVTAALAGPDGPECADALLGDVVGGGGGSVAGCPAATLNPADGRSLEVLVTDLHNRGLRSLYLVGDDSPRSRTAQGVVRAAAAKAGLGIATTPHPDDGLLVLTGWAGAWSTLTDATARATATPTFTGGQFLAPWLVTPNVLAAGSSTMFPLRFVPQEPVPRGYAAMLTTVFADAAPSAAGYLAWAAARDVATGDVRLYGAAAMDVMPGMPGMNHGDKAGAWLPGGSIVPLSGPLT